ncbi:hypothetical protein PY365_04355 [Roseiarcaceae bacterium H3SJ34-1]|uniref:hypothetical protein n=1 Tax=Terripilifer ovatus TaxID=3032367 RepID=UPI003AB9A4B9|nr:hypothetical protein [Roseiarcaceae bacterium H3SJ34-1]
MRVGLRLGTSLVLISIICGAGLASAQGSSLAKFTAQLIVEQYSRMLDKTRERLKDCNELAGQKERRSCIGELEQDLKKLIPEVKVKAENLIAAISE